MILRNAIFQAEHCLARSVNPLFQVVPLVAQNYNTNRNLIKVTFHKNNAHWFEYYFDYQNILYLC